MPLAAARRRVPARARARGARGSSSISTTIARSSLPRSTACASWCVAGARREPLAYVLGSWGFYGLELRCDPRALVPRPETEVLVERCLRAARGGRTRPAIVDVGTGTGAIALALATRLPEAAVSRHRRLARRARAGGRERRRQRPGRPRRAARGRPAGAGRRPSLRPGRLEPALRRRGAPRSIPRSPATSPRPSPSTPDDGGRAILERLATDAPGGAASRAGTSPSRSATARRRWLAERLAGLGYEGVAVTRDLRGVERVVSAHRPG